MFDNIYFEVWTNSGDQSVGRIAKPDEMSYTIDENRLSVEFTPLLPVTLHRFRAVFDYKFDIGDRVFANGYQSWSSSREYINFNERLAKQKGLSLLAKLPGINALTKTPGDYNFADYRWLGVFHASMYGYVRKSKRDEHGAEKFLLFGSLNDDVGFTSIYFDLMRNRIIIEKDVSGKAVYEPFTIIKLAVFEGSYESVFDEYFALFNIDKSRMRRLNGYTSWYNKFGKITEESILNDLAGMDRVKGHANIFQIDDGWQSEIGIWNEANDKFPSGMKAMADKIHEAGMLAGIWLAPFAVARDSEILAIHPDWSIKDKNHKNMLGAVAWGGAYTLDILNEDVRKHIKRIFDTVLNEWGFDMVKLDFLYAQCMAPRKGMSRGEIMAHAMDFLRECVGNKLMLGCGVPIASAIGRVDACRTGCDARKSYRPRFWHNINREMPSTTNSIINSLMRRHLNGRAFVTDPDVFFLRKDNLKFTDTQKRTLAKINNLTGGVLFVSDDIGAYDEAQLALLNDTFTSSNERIVRVIQVGIFRWFYYIDTEFADGRKKRYRLNLKHGHMVDLSKKTRIKKGE